MSEELKGRPRYSRLFEPDSIGVMEDSMPFIDDAWVESTHSRLYGEMVRKGENENSESNLEKTPSDYPGPNYGG